MAGGMPSPPPQVSRIFQEMSNGLLAFNAGMEGEDLEPWPPVASEPPRSRVLFRGQRRG